MEVQGEEISREVTSLNEKVKKQEEAYVAAITELEDAITTKDIDIKDLQGKAVEQYTKGFDTTIE